MNDKYDNILSLETNILDKIEARNMRIKITGNILRYLRKKAGLSQKCVAESLNIVQQTYAGYENGHHEPNLEILIQLANSYAVTLDYITGRIFDEWFIEPFVHEKENDKYLSKLMEHSERQYQDLMQFSSAILDKKLHNEEIY